MVHSPCLPRVYFARALSCQSSPPPSISRRCYEFQMLLFHTQSRGGGRGGEL